MFQVENAKPGMLDKIGIAGIISTDFAITNLGNSILIYFDIILHYTQAHLTRPDAHCLVEQIIRAVIKVHPKQISGLIGRFRSDT